MSPANSTRSELTDLWLNFWSAETWEKISSCFNPPCFEMICYAKIYMKNCHFNIYQNDSQKILYINFISLAINEIKYLTSIDYFYSYFYTLPILTLCLFVLSQILYHIVHFVSRTMINLIILYIKDLIFYHRFCKKKKKNPYIFLQFSCMVCVVYAYVYLCI